MLALIVTTLAVPLAPQAGALAAERQPNALEAELLQQMNAERSARGIAPLTVDNTLNAASLNWASIISGKTDLSHSNDGYAEIIAYGYRTGQITQAWMKSAGHRHLLTDPNLGFAGIGTVCDSSGRIWAVVQFRRIDTNKGTQSSSSPTPVVTKDVEGTDCEGQAGGASLRRLYMAFFQRESEASGLVYWAGEREDGRTLANIADFFAQSPEFQSTYGSLSDREFVSRVYTNVMGRTPDQDGYAFWVGRMQAGLTRGELMIGFSESQEFATRSGIS